MEDHYYTLGIGRKADSEKIKQAYRDCCKKFHPDMDEGNENTFKNVQRAYEVLSDKGKREAYDRELRGGGGGKTAPEGPRNRDVPVERGFSTGRFRHGQTGFGTPGNLFFDEFFTAFGSGSGSGSNIALDLILSKREAREGGIFPISIPVRGHRDKVLHLDIKGPLTKDTRVRIPLGEIGLSSSTLTVDIIIQ